MATYLIHHGVRGMRWGVRRYQNVDGSLTEAGKKRYSSGERAYKDLKKQVHSKRAKLAGSANRWMAGEPIGERSRRVQEESRTLRKKYEDSPEYKDWSKRLRKLDQAGERGDIDPEEYESRREKLFSEKPKKQFDDTGNWQVVLGDKGRVYVDDYLNRGGKKLTMAYLEDLGYNEEAAKYLTEQMIKSNRTLGVV